MDLFPELTACFESIRRLSWDAAERRINYSALCRTKLAAACECAAPKNREAVAEMSQLLSNLCLVSQRRVPDLFMTLHAAQMMVSPAFAGRLGEVLVHEALNWAKPEDFPNLPYLRGLRAGSKSSRFSAEGQQAQLEYQGRVSPTFFVSFLSEAKDHGTGWTISALREPKPDNLKSRGGANAWVWPPCETLLYGTAYAAAEIADRNKRERSPEPFSGSLHDGVDIKATLRAVIRGEKTVQVRMASKPTRTARLTEGGDEPTVFIFEREEAVSDGSWNTFTAGDGEDIRSFVRDPAAFDHATHNRGMSFVVNVSFSVCRRPPEHLAPHVTSLRYLYGCVVFGSPSLCPKQSARWLEECNYTRCPILPYASLGNLAELYRREHQLALDRKEWVSTLIRLALPYARERVIVLLANPQAVATSVFREAQARGIKLELFPITHFPPEQIQNIRHQYLVYPRNVHTIDYPEELQAAFGESPTKHLDRLPPHVRAQLNSED